MNPAPRRAAMLWTLAVTMSCAVAIGGLAPARAAAVSPDGDQDPEPLIAQELQGDPIVRMCSAPMASAVGWGNDARRIIDSGSVSVLGRTVTVDLDRFRLSASPFATASRRMWFNSLYWLAGAAALSHQAGRAEDVQRLVGVANRVVAADPDPGGSSPADYVAAGWEEGTVLRREESLNCLYALTGDPIVADHLREHALANSDPRRYYGLPLRTVHNHGLMANLALIDTADLLGEESYRELAVARIARDVPHVFSPAGWCLEGSAKYHAVSISLYTRAARVLSELGETATAVAVLRRVDAARTLAAHLYTPTGRMWLIGNTTPINRRQAEDGRGALTVVDPVGGIAFGRWSWTDSSTTAWSARAASRPGAHGHPDAGSITWQTGGIPILVDPGQQDYEVASWLTGWSRSRTAHNVAIPASSGKGWLTAAFTVLRHGGGQDDFGIRLGGSGVPQLREVGISNPMRSMTVTDRVRGAKRQTQFWHFDPVWRVVRIRDHDIVLGAGSRRLVVSFPERTWVTVLRGSRSPMGGWVTTGYERMSPAVELRLSGGRTMRTTFKLVR